MNAKLKLSGIAALATILGTMCGVALGARPDATSDASGSSVLSKADRDFMVSAAQVVSPRSRRVAWPRKRRRTPT